jgi:hypothetical protein
MLVGAIVVKTFSNPVIGLPLALLSHFILDIIPHWDGGAPQPPYREKSTILKTGLDLLLGALVIYFLTRHNQNQAYLFLGATVAIFPDLAQGLIVSLNYFLKKNYLSGYLDFHARIQRRLTFIPGLLVTGSVIIISLFLMSR